MKISTRLALVALIAGPAVAQGPRPVGLSNKPASAAYQAIRRQPVALPDSIRQSHWQAGMLIGGGAALIGTFLLYRALPCEGSNCSAKNYLLPVAVFAVIGGLIGSSIPRS